MFLFFLLAFSCQIGLASSTQDKIPVEPNKEKYLFSQAWVWQYQNDWIKAGEPGHKGEMIIYHDSVTKSWLFDGEAFGTSGEGFDFVVGSHDGQYTFCFEDERGKKRKTVRSVPEVTLSRKDNQTVITEFQSYNKATDKTKVFGRNIYGWPVIKGSEYVREYLKTNEKTTRYLADSEVDFQAVIYFNFIEGEVKLPFHFPTDIPLGKVLLEDSTSYDDGKKILLRLREISDTEYHIDLSKYR